MSELAPDQAEAIRQWCISDEGQRRIKALLDELEEAVEATRVRQRDLEKLWCGNTIDNQNAQG